MYNYPKNDIFLDQNLKLLEMIDMNLKYDNMDTNGIFNIFICINKFVNSCINYMLLADPFSVSQIANIMDFS